MNYPNIFSPITIGNTVFKNRIWSAPAGTHLLYGREAYPSDAAVEYYAKKAAGGAACITYSAQNMDFCQPYDNLHAAENILQPESHRFWSRFTDQIHFYGAKVSLELLAFSYHAYDEDKNSVMLTVNGERGTVQLTKEHMQAIAETYADVAECAVAVGFDMILLHFGHGLVVSQFFSKLYNRRTDEFSAQSIENRCRFADMILDAIRARVGNKLLIEMRISGSELGAGGYEVGDCIEMIKHFQDRIDLAHISTGMFFTGTGNITHPTIFLEEGCNAKYAAAVKADPGVTIPVLTLGAFEHMDKIEQTIASGGADVVAMARGLICDAARVNKALDGKEDEAIPCLRCFHCLDYGRAPTFACSANPTVGRERDLALRIPPVGEKKRVVIIGGGPAGMQAALTACERGHEVILLEKEPVLGGKLTFSRGVSFKQTLREFMDYQIHMMQKRGIDVRLNTEATPELVESFKADVVLAAVGADPFVPNIPGIAGANVITAGECYEKLERGEDVGESICVLGGGLVGCETALHLAMDCGKRVTIVEQLSELAAEEMYLTRDALLDRIGEYCEAAYVRARCTEVRADGLVFEDRWGRSHTVPCDTVVLSAGMRARQTEAEAFRGCAKRFARIGDCAKASNVRNATRTGFDAAVQL